MDEDSFVAADAFFHNLDTANGIQSRSSTDRKRRTLTAASNRKPAQVLHRRRESVESPLDKHASLIPAVMSPGTSVDVAAKRQATRFPSVVFGKQPLASSPLPAPKPPLPAYEAPKHVAAEPNSAVHSSIASELYSSATSHLSDSAGDLSALTRAVKALKSASLPGAGPTVTVAPPRTSGMLHPATSTVPLSSLQQQVARMALAAEKPPPAAAPAPAGYARRIEVVVAQKEREALPSPQSAATDHVRRVVMPAATATAGGVAVRETAPTHAAIMVEEEKRHDKTQPHKQQQQQASGAHVPSLALVAEKLQKTAPAERVEEQKQQEITPSRKTAPKTPANTPASAFTATTAPPQPRTAVQPSTVLLGSSPAPTEECPATLYDGDDVVMGDATGGGASAPLSSSSGSDAGGGTSSQRSTVSLKHGPSPSSTTRYSRFRIEALRQGVTPLRVRERRASQSPSMAGGGEGGAGVMFSSPDVAPGAAHQASSVRQETRSSPSRVTEKLSYFKADRSTPSPAPAVIGEAAKEEGNLAKPAAGVSAQKQQQPSPPPAATPTASSASGGSLSNNPLYAGTPSHPTPPSISGATLPMAGALRTPPSSGGSSAASEGIKLAEKLHDFAEKLHTPVASSRPSPVDATKVETPAAPVAFEAPRASTVVPKKEEDATFQFSGDVQALLLALNTSTPHSTVHAKALAGGAATGRAARALAAASTEERPNQQRRRRSSLSPGGGGGAPILDLSGFNADGERAAPGGSTPVLATKRNNAEAAPPAATAMTTTMVTGRSEGGQRVGHLQQKIEELEVEREEAASLLAGYQGTIAGLEESHSAAMVRLQSENAMLKSEAGRLRAERADISAQFETLYRDKYNPLKNEAMALRRGAEAMRARLAEDGESAKRVALLESQLAAAQATAAAAQQSAVAAKAEAEVARDAQRLADERAAAADASIQEAERRWAAKFAAEAERAKQMVEAKHAEIAAWRDKHAALARQHDDAVHRAHVAQAARERKAAEVGRKEDEICGLEVRLQEYERILAAYKAENDKFGNAKLVYKSRIDELEKEVQAKEAEKATLANLCNETMMDLANAKRAAQQ